MTDRISSGDRALSWINRCHLAGAREQLNEQRQAGCSTSAIAAKVARLQAQVDAFEAREAAELAERSAGIF